MKTKEDARQQMVKAKKELLREEARLLNTLGDWEPREDLWVRLALIDDFTAVEIAPESSLTGRVVVHLRTRDSFRTSDNYQSNKLVFDAELCGKDEKMRANVDILLPWFGFILEGTDEVKTEATKAAEPKKAKTRNPLLRPLEPVSIPAPIAQAVAKPPTLRARVKAYVEANPGCNRMAVCKAFGGEETAEGRSSGSALTYLWQSSQIIMEFGPHALQTFRGLPELSKGAKLPREGTLLRDVYDYVVKNPGCRRTEVEKVFQMPGAGPALSELKASGLINVTLRLNRLLLSNGKTRTLHLQHFSAK